MTIKLNVIGDPIKHSKSPEVHGSILNILKIPYEYEKVKVKKNELDKYIENAIKNNVTGFNLTMPHKVDIIPYLDGIDSEAELFGAVNTVKIKDNKLYGYNTDANGFITSLNLGQNGFNVKGRKIIILGAGGVVSTLALKFSQLEASKIIILNRTVQKAEAICMRVMSAQDNGSINKVTSLKFDSSNSKNVKNYLDDCDMIINATPLGMSGISYDYTDLSFLDKLNNEALAVDLIYNPEKTAFLKYAEKNGNKIMNGYGMLICQAILADEIYLDTKLDISKLYTKFINFHC